MCPSVAREELRVVNRNASHSRENSRTAMIVTLALLLLVVAMTETIIVSGLATSSYWSKTYGRDAVFSIQQASNGGYVAAGFTTEFGARASDFWVLRLDSTGSVVWQKAYGGYHSEDAFCVRQTSDGGYVVTGYTGSFGAGMTDIWVLKLDSAGGVDWQKTYGGTGDDYASSIQQTSDEGYIVTGYTDSFGAGGDVWVLKLTANGSVAWQKTYGGTASDKATDVQQTSDGGYVVTGYTGSFGAGMTDIWVLKLNSTGDVTRQITYGGSSDDYATSIQQTADGGYILEGTTSSFGAGTANVWVLKLNSTGGVAWQKTYGGTYFDFACSIQETTDGAYIAAGTTWSFGAGGDDAWLLKLNSTGGVAWQKTYGGSGYDFACEVQQISDGGFIMAGYTSSPNTAWVVKLGTSGDIVWDPFSSASTHITDVAAVDSNAVTSTTLVTPMESTATGQDTYSTPEDTNVAVNIQSGNAAFLIILVVDAVGVTLAVGFAGIILLRKRRRGQKVNARARGQTEQLLSKVPNIGIPSVTWC